MRGAMDAVPAPYELEQARRDVVPELTAVREAQHCLNKLNAARLWALSEDDIVRIKRDLTEDPRREGHRR